MQRLACSSRIEGVLVDWVVTRPAAEPRLPVAWLSPEGKAAELQRIQAERAKLAAYEADVMLGFTADRPDEDDPAPGTPGARSKDWRQTEPEFPGVSESFPDELGMVLGVGQGTAAHKLRRAWTWRHRLPATEAAQPGGAIDGRRAAILADSLEHAVPALARRVEAIVVPEAGGLNFSALKRRILEVLLALGPPSADENRKLAEQNADVFLEPRPARRAPPRAEPAGREAPPGPRVTKP